VTLLRRRRDQLIAALARWLWRGPGPERLRLWAIAGLLRRTPGSDPASRQLGLLAAAIAAAGAAALEAQPAATARLVAALRVRGAAPLLIAGDSHSRLYVHRSRRGEAWLLPLHHVATGASARGLANAASRSGEGARLRRLVRDARAAGLDGPWLLVFGQVDVEFVHTFKRLESDPPAPLAPGAFEGFIEETLRPYLDYAAGLADIGAPVALATVFPPALSDQAWRQGYLDAHIAAIHGGVDPAGLATRLKAAEVADLRTRTAQHDDFNRRLAGGAAARGLAVVDVAGRLPRADGVVEAALLGAAAGRDHHLDREAVRPFVTPELWRLVAGTAA
jgi:hypothetical protein